MWFECRVVCIFYRYFKWYVLLSNIKIICVYCFNKLKFLFKILIKIFLKDINNKYMWDVYVINMYLIFIFKIERRYKYWYSLN